MESTVYKIRGSKRHSGIFYGPVTYVYGFGVLALILYRKFLFDRWKGSKFVKLAFTFLFSWFVLTLIEWLGGNILHMIFDIHMWDYSTKPFHWGRYICLELSLVWGFFGTIYIYYLKDFVDQFIALIPKKLTIFFLVLQLIDGIFVFFYKFL